MNFSLLDLSFVMVLVLISTCQGFTNEENCGVATKPKPSLLSRIIGGKDADPGQWPWQALIEIERGNRSIMCGGTLLDRCWILTAAHCFNSSDQLSDIYVYLGERNRSELAKPDRYPLDKKICHSEYAATGTSTHANDICLLKLSSNVEYTDYIRPICLPSNDSTLADGAKCSVSGWGNSETGDKEGESKPSILQYAEVEVISRQTCIDWYKSNPEVIISEKQFCAGYENGRTDTCDGDSGGPFVCQEEVTVSNKTFSAYVLHGITSFGLECAIQQRPGIYTRVLDFLAWINKNGACDVHTTATSWVVLFGISAWYIMTTTSTV